MLNNLLNPKAAVFFTALLLQFLPSHGLTLLATLLTLAMAAAALLAGLAIYVTLAHRARTVFHGRRMTAFLDHVTGITLVGRGARLAFTRVDGVTSPDDRDPPAPRSREQVERTRDHAPTRCEVMRVRWSITATRCASRDTTSSRPRSFGRPSLVAVEGANASTDSASYDRERCRFSAAARNEPMRGWGASLVDEV